MHEDLCRPYGVSSNFSSYPGLTPGARTNTALRAKLAQLGTPFLAQAYDSSSQADSLGRCTICPGHEQELPDEPARHNP